MAVPLLALGLPVIAVLIAMTSAHVTPRTIVTVGSALFLAWLWGAHALVTRLTRPVHVVANLLAAIREGDLSIRAHEMPNPSDPVELVFHEMNLLADKLHRGQTEVAEVTALLAKIVDEVDVAIMLLDEQEHVSFLNPIAEKLIGQQLAMVRGRSIHEAGLERLLDANDETPIQLAGASYRVRRSRSTKRAAARAIALIDVHRTLRREQRASWQENHSRARSRDQQLANAHCVDGCAPTRPRARARRHAEQEALNIIARRAEGLSRFMDGYARLAKMPPPVMERVSVRALILGVVQLERRMQLEVIEGPPSGSAR